MSEKRQRKITDQLHDQWTLNSDGGSFHVNETPIDYLSHTNTTDLIKQAVHTLLQNRPEDPIQFLVDFFAPSENSSIEMAYEKLSWAHYSSPVYQRNALQVYDTLTTAKNEGTSMKGLLGKQFNCLLEKLCDDLPHNYSQHVYKRICKRNNHVITFNPFYRHVLMLHVLRDFIQIVKDIFNDLDVNTTGTVSRKLCHVVQNNLFASVIHQTDKTNLSTYSLSKNGDVRDRLEALDKAFSKLFLTNSNASYEDTIREDEFVDMNIEKFLETSNGCFVVRMMGW